MGDTWEFVAGGEVTELMASRRYVRLPDGRLWDERLSAIATGTPSSVHSDGSNAMKEKIDDLLKDILRLLPMDDERGSREDFDWKMLGYLLNVVRQHMAEVPLAQNGAMLVNAFALVHSLVVQEALLSDIARAQNKNG